MSQSMSQSMTAADVPQKAASVGRAFAAEPLARRIHGQMPHLSTDEAAELARILGILVETFHPERIHLFGSQARGGASADSDFDLLVVVSRADEPLYRLGQRAHDAIGRRRIALDILFMTRADFEWRSRVASSLPAAVLREGRTLYDAAPARAA